MRLVLELADPAQVLDALGERLDVAVHHRRRRRHAEPVRVAHDVQPVGGPRLLGGDHVADAVDEDLGAAAGDRVEARVAETRERGRDAQLRAARDVLDLGRRQRVQVDRVALLERAEEVLVVVDAEVRVVPALHEDARAADRERLLDLLVDDRLREEVALGAVAGPAVEGAEVAVGDADVRVVDVPVDDERDPVRVGAASAQLRRRPCRPRRGPSTRGARAPRRRRSARRPAPCRGSRSIMQAPPLRRRSGGSGRGRARRRRAPARGT